MEQPRKMDPGMWRYPRNPNFCCIYRVPNLIREVNPEAYTPQLLLIGPLHRSMKSQALKALGRGDNITYTKSMGYLNMEEHKKTYLTEFAARFGEEKIINGFNRIIKEEEETIREGYSESTSWLESPDFVEMVLHDSVFLLEFILRCTKGGTEKIGDPIQDEVCLRSSVSHDLILLENQLPYFILKKLFDPIVPRILPNQTFRKLIMDYFGCQHVIGNDPEFRHFTDLFRSAHLEVLPKHDVEDSKPIQHMYNAVKLESGGVKFKVVGKQFNVRFENGYLEIPQLQVHDKFEVQMRNIMALEQCHYPYNAHVCNFYLFLDYLIDSEEDVDLLVKKGIIQNWIGHPASVAQMVNKLGLGIIELGSYYSDIAVKVNAYSENPLNRSKAILKRVYFGNLWTGTATIAATLLLVMTLIQTWASVTQVNQNEH